MKILYTRKQHQQALTEEIAKYNEKIDKLMKYNQELLFKNSNLEDENEKLKSLNEKYEIENSDIYAKNNELKLKIREINGAKGGLTKQVNRLEKELAEANEKLSQRYILKELAPTKSKNTQIMKTKSSSKTSNIIKNIKGE